MRRLKALIQEHTKPVSPEGVMGALWEQPGAMLLRSGLFRSKAERHSFVLAAPFQTFRSRGVRCELNRAGCIEEFEGDPWGILGRLLEPYAQVEQGDFPFPLGGCFGYWGYGLKDFVEPRAAGQLLDDLNLPDCHVGFYGSLLVFDHHLNKQFIVATGWGADGQRTPERASRQVEFWSGILQESAEPVAGEVALNSGDRLTSNLDRAEYVGMVQKAQAYIRQGDIYQVNLAQRLHARHGLRSRDFFLRLLEKSPAPFAAHLNCGEFQIVSSSPELFLRMSGQGIRTRPIKGTRPRHPDPTRDAQLTYELQTSSKEMAELVMITDLLRNDLGRVCEYGSVQVPELVRLERYPQVQHLVSTVEGRLRPGLTHLQALKSCFPGGSITGAPKLRAMQIINELEPVARGPYTGALGYLGFNNESQLSMIIRAAICRGEEAWFHVGAGIVADSVPEAEYEETLAKGAGLGAALTGQIWQPKEL